MFKKLTLILEYIFDVEGFLFLLFFNLHLEVVVIWGEFANSKKHLKDTLASLKINNIEN